MNLEPDHIYQRLYDAGIHEIDAGYRKFALVFKRTLAYKGDKCFGVTDWDKGEISLVTTQGKEDARETLVHELMHVVLEIVGLGGHEQTGIITRRTNEELVTLISRGLLLLMNLNPHLFSIIDEQSQTRSSSPSVDTIPL